MDTALKTERSSAALGGVHRLAGSDVGKVNLIMWPQHAGWVSIKMH